MKKITSNNEGSPPNSSEKSNLPKSKTDIESINSTMTKIEDFLSEHDVTSDQSVIDGIQPLESSSFPVDYKKMEQEQKEKKKTDEKILEIKKVLASKRSDFEDIRMHLEKRAEEIRKRIKILKIDKNDENEKKDKGSIDLSYHSTEFNPDYGSNVPFKKQDQSLSNKERLRIFTDKELKRKKSNEQDLREKSSSLDDCSPMTHAIFVHLAKLKSVKKVCTTQKSKEEYSAKSKEEMVSKSETEMVKGRKMIKKSKEDQVKPGLNVDQVKPGLNVETKKKVKEPVSESKEIPKKSKENITANIQVKRDQVSSKEDNDLSVQRSNSCSSIRSRFSDE